MRRALAALAVGFVLPFTFASPSHAGEWQGWASWCHHHPVKAQHMYVCRFYR